MTTLQMQHTEKYLKNFATCILDAFPDREMRKF